MVAHGVNENCHHTQNDPHGCKIKIEKFHFDILRCYGVSKEVKFHPPPPPAQEPDRVKLMTFMAIGMQDKNTKNCTKSKNYPKSKALRDLEQFDFG